MKRPSRPKSQRVLRAVEDRIASCEFHLLALWEARRKAEGQEERYKQIAAELRILICRHGRNKPLLLDLMKEFGVEGRANPKGERILMVGWKEDHEYQNAYRTLESPPTDAKQLIAELHKRLPPAPPVPLEEYVEKGVAVGNESGEYSYKQLILAVSQQIGSSHEDHDVEELLQSFRAHDQDGRPTFISPLLIIADATLSLGSFLFMWLVRARGYKTKYLSVDFFGQTNERWQVSYPEP